MGRESRRLPRDGRIGSVLHGNQQPLIRLGQPGGNRLRGSLALGLGLFDLMRRKIKRFALREDGLPRQVPPNRFVEVLEPGLVRCKEDERVAVEPWRGAPRFENGRCGSLGQGPWSLRVPVINAEHDETGFPLVRHLVAGLRSRVDAAEAAHFTQCGSQTTADCLRHPVRLSPQLLGPVFSQLRDGRSGVVPVAVTVLIQVGRAGGQPPQSIPEDSRRLSGEHAAELDSAVLNATLG